MQNIKLNNLTFIFEGTEKKVINDLTAAFATGWTGIVGPNGCGKSTLLQILNGKLSPTAGTVSGVGGTSYHCQQETTASPDGLDDFSESYDKDVMKLKASLDLFGLEVVEWEDLSHGERKRIQLGIALSKRPELLLLDEPTNHLDENNRRFIIDTLKTYKGIGILVSHDRELLDALCSQCVIYDGGRAISTSGNYSDAEAYITQDAKSKQKQANTLRETSRVLKREVGRIKEIDQGSKNRLSKRGIVPKDRDAKEKINAGRLTNKDSTLSQKKVNLNRRISEAEEEIQNLRTEKSYADSVFFIENKTHKKMLLHLREKSVSLPGVNISFPELVIRSESKIGITGLNGSGKSSLINWILESDHLKNCDTFYLRQELDEKEKAILIKRLQDCSKEEYPKALQIIARLGSDAKQILSGKELSAGEVRKVAIALAIVKQVDLLILDEPTNHLDLHSVKHLEKALSLSNLAVLMVSHDRYFVDAVCPVRWHLEKSGQDTHIEIIEA